MAEEILKIKAQDLATMCTDKMLGRALDELLKGLAGFPRRIRNPGQAIIFLAFFCVNVLAAYAPTPLFLREASSSLSPKDEILRVPVALAYLAVESSVGPKAGDSIERLMQLERELPLIGRGLLVAFLLFLFVASAGLHNSRKAWVAMPIIVLVYSVLQGIIALFIIGLNALGGV
jgi:hypothetical protein